MKRIVAGISVMIFILCTGCTTVVPVNTKTVNHMAGSFTTDVTMTTSETETTATLTRYGFNAWSVVFNEPQALSGVQLDFFDNEVKASYKGLEFSVPQSAQALKTELSDLMKVVDDMSTTPELDGTVSDGVLVCEGQLETGGYTLEFTENGIPTTFSLPSYGLVIAFSNFNELAEPPTTEPETIPFVTITDETEESETNSSE